MLAALGAAQDLPGASCVAEREVFDACLEQGVRVNSRAYALAIRVCAQCPALGPCSAWVTSMPIDGRPHGVTGGLIRRGRWT